MSDTTSEILNRLAGTYLAIEELNTAIPKLKKSFQKNQKIVEEIRDLSSSAEKSLKDVEKQGEQLNLDTRKAIASIDSAVKKAQSIQAQISKKIESFPDTEAIQSSLVELSGGIVQLSERVDLLEQFYAQKIEAMENQLKALLGNSSSASDEDGINEDNIKWKKFDFDFDPGPDTSDAHKSSRSVRGRKNSSVEDDFLERMGFVAMDEEPANDKNDQKGTRSQNPEDRKNPKGSANTGTRRSQSEKTKSDKGELYSIDELAKLVGQDELLVVRQKWRGDFCFLVKSISRGYASGTQYLNGEAYKETRFRSDAEEFRLYSGPSKQKILNQI